MNDYTEYEQALNQAERLQTEMHKFISDAQRFAKDKGRTVPEYESLKTVFLLIKISELQNRI